MTMSETKTEVGYDKTTKTWNAKVGIVDDPEPVGEGVSTASLDLAINRAMERLGVRLAELS